MSLFFPILTLFLSLTVLIIAALQWRVADNKLRLDLFDRRHKVYDATRNFVAVIVKEATFTDSQLVDFNIGTSEHRNIGRKIPVWARCRNVISRDS